MKKIWGLLLLGVVVVASVGLPENRSNPAETEKAVLARLGQIQEAAQALDPERVFSYVLENDKGALVQNGRWLQTRAEALESTRRGFQGLQAVHYAFEQQNITLLSPTVALAVGQGVSAATTKDGRSFTIPFSQSVVLVLTNGEWKVFHAHRSTATAK